MTRHLDYRLKRTQYLPTSARMKEALPPSHTSWIKLREREYEGDHVRKIQYRQAHSFENFGSSFGPFSHFSFVPTWLDWINWVYHRKDSFSWASNVWINFTKLVEIILSWWSRDLSKQAWCYFVPWVLFKQSKNLRSKKTSEFGIISVAVVEGMRFARR